ncbi:MAG: FMN-binding protein [Bacillota bacterium]
MIALVVTITLAMLASGCSRRVYKDGTFTARSATGTTEVSLTLQNDKIVSVKIVEFGRDGAPKDIDTYLVCVGDSREPLLKTVHPLLAQRIVEKNSWDIDGYTGATATVNGVKEAAKAALELAKR